ncbi:MAG: STAS domain-containing protein [Acidiferrobacteraceae bacterium]
MEPNRGSIGVMCPGTPAPIVLARVLGVAQARVLHQEWSEVLKQKCPVVWDAGAVHRVDAAVMQLLAAFCEALRAQNIPWQWAAAAPALREAAHLLGLDASLGFAQ